MSSPTPFLTNPIIVNKPYKHQDNPNKMYYVSSCIISMIICIALIGFAIYHTKNNSNQIDTIAIISSIGGIIGLISTGIIGYLTLKPINMLATFV